MKAKKTMYWHVQLKVYMGAAIIAASLIPINGQSQVFQSSRTGDKETWTLPIPVGAVVYKADNDEVTRGLTRTIGCAEIYDSPNKSMYYTGGPIVQRHFERQVLLDTEEGKHIKVFSEWVKESGLCQQHHIERRTISCGASQFGEHHEERRYYYEDTESTVGINTSNRLNDTGWIRLASTCRNR